MAAQNRETGGNSEYPRPAFHLSRWERICEWRQIRGDCRKSIESLPTVLLVAA